MNEAERTEILGRREALREMVSRLQAETALPNDLVCVPPGVLQDVLDEAQKAIEDHANDPVGEERESWTCASSRLLYAEALLNGFKALMEQRRTGPWAEALTCADRVAGNGYEVATARARDLGIPRTAANPKERPPICRFDIRFGPAAYSQEVAHLPVRHDTLLEATRDVLLSYRRARTQAEAWPADDLLAAVEEREATIRRLENALGSYQTWPFPVILLPPHYLEQPVLLTTLLHEVGHVLDGELGLKAKVERHLGTIALTPQRRTKWVGWSEEITADLFGLALGGLGVIHALAHVAAAGHPGVSHPRYPGMAVRAAVVLEAARPLKLRLPLRDRLRLNDLVRASLRRGENRCVDEARAVVSHLLAMPLGGVQLRDLLTFDEGLLPWARLPGEILLQEVKRGPSGTGALDAFLNRARCLPRADWQRSPEWYHHDRQHVPLLAPTFHAHPGDLFKIPPVELMVAHDELDFVAATNGRLADSLVEAGTRRERPWNRVAIYFATDEALDLLTTGLRTKEELKREKEAALRDLRAFMATHPETAWELREFWRPTLFASYWWQGGELRRVHTSGCVWGRDLRRAPATDYRYLPGYPNPELDELRVGLLELRSARYSRPLRCPRAP